MYCVYCFGILIDKIDLVLKHHMEDLVMSMFGQLRDCGHAILNIDSQYYNTLVLLSIDMVRSWIFGLICFFTFKKFGLVC